LRGAYPFRGIAERHDAPGHPNRDGHAVERIGELRNSGSLRENENAGVSIRQLRDGRADDARSLEELRRVPALSRERAAQIEATAKWSREWRNGRGGANE
jgi:hypothetical protein